VADRFFSGVPQPPPPWRLLPEPFFFHPVSAFKIQLHLAVNNEKVGVTAGPKDGSA
jgi:hypothetical protein